MARIQGIDVESAAPEIQEIFGRQMEEYGSVLKTSRIYGLRPTILKGMLQLFKGIKASGLIDPQLQSMLYVRVASINGCPF